MAGLFGGLKTGDVAWLGELTTYATPAILEGTRTLLAALGEADRVFRRHNLKLTAELFDPDRRVSEDEKTR
jgi:hypothetical protein